MPVVGLRLIRATSAWAILLAGLLTGCATPGESAQDITAALTESDQALLAQTFQQAMETARIGESLNWENPDTGHRGTVMPTRTDERAGQEPCREYQQTVTVENGTAVSVGNACRAADGSWSVAAPPAVAGRYVVPRPDYDYYPYYPYGYHGYYASPYYGYYPYSYYGGYPYGHHGYSLAYAYPYYGHFGYGHGFHFGHHGHGHFGYGHHFHH